MRFLLLTVIGTLLAGASVRAQFELSNGIAAIADDAVITVQDVRQVAADTIETYRRTYRNDRETLEQKQIGALSDALESLIDRQLVLHDFENSGGVIQESYIDDLIKARIQERFGDRVTLIKGLQAQGITYETFRQRERERLIGNMMQRKNVGEVLLISPAKIERYYQTNLHRFKLGNQVKLRVIVLNRPQTSEVSDVLKLASEIKAKIDGGAPFAEMATIYSEGSERKEGGLWGLRQESQLRKGLWEIAYGLKTGECSRVVSMSSLADGTYWVCQYGLSGEMLVARRFNERERDVLIEEKKFENGVPAGEEIPPPQVFYLIFSEEKEVARTRALQEVRDEIEMDLVLEERARLQKKWIDKLRAKSFVRTFN